MLTRGRRSNATAWRLAMPGLVAAAVAAAIAWPAGGGAPRPQGAGAAPKRLHATPATLGNVFDRAAGGEVIELAPGDYGTFTGGFRASTVTFVAAPGADVRLAADLDGASHLRFERLTVTAATIVRSADIAFVRNRFTGPALIDAGTGREQRILFDGNAHEGIDVCPTCFEGRITVRGRNNTRPNGVRIVNSLFSGGNADGVQIVGGAYGTQIGPGNRFVGLKQGPAGGPHTDPIQLYGSSHTRIVGNYLRGNTTGIMAPDGADGEVIERNVITTDGYPWGIVLGADRGSVVSHNTLPDGACSYGEGCGTLHIDAGNRHRPSRGTVVRDNILGALAVSPDSALALQRGNLVAAGGGPHDVSGRPRFVGGAAPASWAGFALAPGSPATATGAGACDARHCAAR